MSLRNRARTFPLAYVVVVLVSCGTNDGSQPALGTQVSAPGPTAPSLTSAPTEDSSSNEGCELLRLGLFDQIVSVRVPAMVPARIAKRDGFPDTPIVVVQVDDVILKSPTATTIVRPGTSIELAIYTGTGESLKDSYFGAAFDAGSTATALLFTDYTGAAAQTPVFLSELDGSLTLFPDSCNDAQRLEDLNLRVGGPGIDAIGLLADLNTINSGSDSCVIAKCSAIKDALLPLPPDVPTWNELAPNQRNVNMQEVPLDVLPELLLVGVVVSYDSEIAQGVFKFGCELGGSVGWATDARPTLLPVSACRRFDLVLSFEDFDGNLSQVGVISSEIINEAERDGLAISLASDSASSLPAIAGIRLLKDGDLEKLVGMTSEQLETLRRTYSGADRTE